MNNIGFMQGRLSPLVDNQIQAFPFENWQDEFPLAKDLGLSCIEWTLDYPKLHQNPLLLKSFEKQILKISKDNNIKIPSITLDCCMQRPFWKAKEKLIFNELVDDFKLIIESAHNIGAKILVVPLVDNGSINNESEFEILKNTLTSLSEFLIQNQIKIAFESDYNPPKLKYFISNFNKQIFGINYDSGNSASLGFEPNDEFDNYGERIINIHLKDRELHGTTVRLGDGNANFNDVFKNIKRFNYTGNLILQTARSKNDEHIKELKINLDFISNIILKK